MCNDYFLPSVEYICEDLTIPKVFYIRFFPSYDETKFAFSPILLAKYHLRVRMRRSNNKICSVWLFQDVAAATFMAIATTTPEFFTNVISTFITESDIGLGAIIGSLMFNTLGVAAVASIAAPNPVQLDWWPITRDSILYASNILLMIVFAWDNRITLNETIIMVVLLGCHFLFIFQSKRIMPRIKWFFEDYLHCCRVKSYGNLMIFCCSRHVHIIPITVTLIIFGFSTDLPSTLAEKKSQDVKPIDQQPSETTFPSPFGKIRSREVKPIGPQSTETNIKDANATDMQNKVTISSVDNALYMIYMIENDAVLDMKQDEDIKEMNDSLWHLPDTTTIGRLWWAYIWPIKFVLTITIPNPKTFRNLYPLTFIMCIIWIGINAYLIVWMVTVIGMLMLFAVKTPPTHM